MPQARSSLQPTTSRTPVAFAASLLAKSTGEALLPAMGLSEHAPGQVGPHAQYADLLVVDAADGAVLAQGACAAELVAMDEAWRSFGSATGG